MAGRDNLRRLRIFVAVIAVVGVVQAVGAVVAALGVDDEPSAGVQLAVAAGVAIIGASTVAARSRFLRRPWKTDNATSLAMDYSTRIVVQVILALGAANIAYAGAILSGAPWIVALGLVFFVVPLLSAVPTQRNVQRVQAELDALSCRFDLVESLRTSDTV
jgi:hypothetical protein